VPLLIIDDLGMRKLPLTAAEELLEIIMRAMNAPARCSLRIDRGDWANCWATARRLRMLDRLLHHGTSQVRPAQLAHQNRRPEEGNDKAKAKTKAIWMPGKRRPAASDS